MAAILAWVMRLVAIVTDMQGALNWIRGLLAAGGAPVAEGSLLVELYATYTGVKTADAYLTNGGYGLPAIAALIAAARADILAAIAALPAGSSVPTASQNATGVWAALDPISPGGIVQRGTELGRLYDYSQFQLAAGGWPAGTRPFYIYSGQIETAVRNGDSISPPTPDWADVLPDERLVDWMNRTAAAVAWHEDTSSGYVYGYVPGTTIPDSVVIYTVMTDRQFQAMHGALSSRVPVWPGIANVTLGTPVALSSDLTVDGPLDGILVTVTTPPTALGKFQIGDRTWWFRLGQISFVSDNGEVEPWQYLAWDQSLYCPSKIAHPASAVLRVLAGAEGLATPWLAN